MNIVKAPTKRSKATTSSRRKSYLSLSVLGSLIFSTFFANTFATAEENRDLSKFNELYSSLPNITMLSDNVNFNESIVTQQGYSNNAIISQLGDANRAVIDQLGSRNEALSFQVGSNNDLAITQVGNDHYSSISQHGNNHTYTIEQFGSPKESQVTQVGIGAQAEIYQTSSLNSIPLSIHQNSTGGAAVRIIQ
ncbi:MAG: hypothetical protein ACQEUK_15640 [Pseudomonadota bacterium]